MNTFELAAIARRKPAQVVLAGLLAAAAAVPVTAAAQAVKVGCVNFARVIEESPQAQEVSRKLQTEFSPRDAELRAQKADYDKRVAEYERNGAVMGADERQRVESELSALRRSTERSQEEFLEDFNARRSEELQRLQTTIVTRVRAYAEAQKYDVILADAVYCSAATDITTKVLDALKTP